MGDGMNHKDPYGIPNCNFTRITKKDERWKLFKASRIKQGFDESEFWDFQTTLCSWLLPRVEWYYKHIVKKFQKEDTEVFQNIIYCLWFLKNTYDVVDVFCRIGETDQGLQQHSECRKYLQEHLDYILNMGW